MRIIIGILLLFFCAFQVQSQVIRQKGYYIIPQAGFLYGDQRIDGQAMVAGGIEYKGWGLGIAAGMDWYKIRTVPVLLDIRTNIPVARQPLFAYGNLGWDIAAPLDKQYYLAGSFDMRGNRFTNGMYGEAGLGYALLNKSKKGFLLSIGFTTKTVTERFMENVYIMTPPYTSYAVERRLNYTFNRFIFKLGYKF